MSSSSLGKPWEYTASGWLYHTGVHEPWIGEIAPSQYARLGPQQKRRYDKMRSLQWQESSKAKEEWRRLVAEAFERGEITESTPSLSDEARRVIDWYKEQRVKEQEAERERRKEAELKIEKYRQAQALKKFDFAKWWVQNSPRQVPGFEHVLRQEANEYWRAVHGQISERVAKYMIQEVEEARRIAGGGKNPGNPNGHGPILLHARRLENVREAAQTDSCVRVDFRPQRLRLHGTTILVCPLGGLTVEETVKDYAIEGDIVTGEGVIPELEKEVEQRGCKISEVHEHFHGERHAHLSCTAGLPEVKKILDLAQWF